MNKPDRKTPMQNMDVYYAMTGLGLMAFGIYEWTDRGDLRTALFALPLGVMHVLFVPIRRRGGNLNKHWIWVVCAVVIVALLTMERRGWFS